MQNKKTKAKTEKTHRYAAILYSLLSEFRDVLLDDLLDGLPPSREVNHLMEVVPRSNLVSKPTHRLNHSKA